MGEECPIYDFVISENEQYSAIVFSTQEGSYETVIKDLV
jgi:hypothetical protein